MTTPNDLTTLTSDQITALQNSSKSNIATPLTSDAITSNQYAVDYSAFTSAQLTSSTIKSVNSVNAIRDISYQILAEPLKAIGTEGSINTNIAANTTMAQAVIGGATDKIANVTALSQDPNANNSQLKDSLTNAAKKSATVAQTEANHAELAHGHKMESIAGSHTIKSNSIRFNSDTTTSISSPHTLTLTQDYQVQANNSYTVIADVNLEQYKQQVTLVDGSSITQAQTGVSVFTNTSDVVSNNTRSIGLQSHTIIGSQNSLIADSTLTSISGGDIQTAAYGNVGIQGNGNISIVAAKSNSPKTSSATNSDISSVPVTNTGGSVLIVSNPNPSTTNLFSLSDQGVFTSTTQSMVSTSSGLNVMTGSQGAAITSDGFSYVGNSTNGVYVKGNKTFIGAFAAPLSTILQPNIPSIPALPVMPKLPNQQLANCLPKTAKAPAATKPSAVGSISTDPNAVVVPTSNPNDVTVVPTIPTPSTTNTNTAQAPTSSNVKRLPTQAPGTTSATSPSSTSNTKLPIPASSTFDSTSSTSNSPIFTEAITGIYSDKYNPDTTQSNPQSNVLDILSYGKATLGTQLVNTLTDQCAVTNYSNSLVNTNEYFTTSTITSALTGVVPSTVINSFLYQPFYVQLLSLSASQLSTFNVSTTDFPGLDVNQVGTILNLISTYPASKLAIQNLVAQAQTPPAIGGLLNLNFSNLSSIQSSIINLTTIPNLVSSKNLASTILGAVTPAINSSLVGTPFSSLLTNPSLLGLPTTGTNGANVASLLTSSIDKMYTTAITQALQIELTQLVGASTSSAISSSLPAIKTILNNIQVGKPIDPTSYINQFASILAAATGNSQITAATGLYNNLKGLITNINSGDITKILTGGNLSSLLTGILGPSSSGEVSKIFATVQAAVGAYQAIKLLPQLITLMNQYNIPAINQIGIALSCLDLFNKVQALITSLGALSNGSNSSQAAASLLENAGALTQASNTINSLSPADAAAASTALSNQYGTTINLQDYTFTLSTELDSCFNLPQLNTYESQVNIVNIQDGLVSFNLANYQALINNPYSLPSINDTIQIRVVGFLDITTNNYLTPYQTDYQYTPSIYNFIVSTYDINNNIGTAIYDNSVSTLVLQNSQGVLYQYSSQAIGRILNLDIQEAFILI